VRVYAVALQPLVQRFQGAGRGLTRGDVLLRDLKCRGLFLDGVVGEVGKLPLIGIILCLSLISLVILLGRKSDQAFLVQKYCQWLT